MDKPKAICLVEFFEVGGIIKGKVAWGKEHLLPFRWNNAHQTNINCTYIFSGYLQTYILSTGRVYGRMPLCTTFQKFNWYANCSKTQDNIRTEEQFSD